jgi:hypothetical protein
MKHLMRLRNLFVLALLLLTAGCNLPFFGSGGAATPEDAARQSHSRSTAQNFSILGSRIAGRRAVVFSTETAAMPSKASQTQMFNADIVVMDMGGWHPSSSQGLEGSASPPLPSLVCGGISIGSDSLGYYTIVSGRVRLPDVASVEVDFTSGQTLKDTTGDGMFAAIRDKMDNPVELRLLDANGQKVHSINLSQYAPPPVPRGPAQAVTAGGSSFQTIECSP